MRKLARARSVLGLLALLAVITLDACAKDSLGPQKGQAVWIAQSVSGRVINAASYNPIPGATVFFLAGLDESSLVPLASAVTDESGNYSIVRANQTGTPADFWWFTASGSEAVNVYLALRVGKSGFQLTEVRHQVTRLPSIDPPTRVLESYQLTLNASLRQIQDW